MSDATCCEFHQEGGNPASECVNPILHVLIKRTVAGQISAIDALNSAWRAGINEGRARERVTKTMEDKRYGCEGCGKAILDGPLCAGCAVTAVLNDVGDKVVSTLRGDIPLPLGMQCGKCGNTYPHGEKHEC